MKATTLAAVNARNNLPLGESWSEGESLAAKTRSTNLLPQTKALKTASSEVVHSNRLPSASTMVPAHREKLLAERPAPDARPGERNHLFSTAGANMATMRRQLSGVKHSSIATSLRRASSAASRISALTPAGSNASHLRLNRPFLVSNLFGIEGAKATYRELASATADRPSAFVRSNTVNGG